MKSNFTKIAAILLLVLAAVFAITQLAGPSPLTPIAFAEIAQAMKQATWMYQVNTGFERGVEGQSEQWFGFADEVLASKWPIGEAMFMDLRNKTMQRYNAADNTIVVLRMDNVPVDLSSPAALLESLVKMAQDQGANVTARQEEYHGRNTQVQEMMWSDAGSGHDEQHLLRLYIDPQSKLLQAADVEATDANGEIIIDGEVIFSYPRTGPASIYDLGVPQDAEIIDQTTAMPEEQ